MRRQRAVSALSLLLILLALLPIASALRPFLFAITSNDLQDSPDSDPPDDSPEWDEFGDPDPASASDDDHDPGSWRPALEPATSSNSSSDDPYEELYLSGIRAMISAASSGDPAAMDSAASDIEAAASAGHPNAQSALAFLSATGLSRPQCRPKSYLYHHFAADAGNMQSKMVLAYTYFRQELYDKAVELYAELAEAAVTSFVISKEPPVMEPVRLHSGTEENKGALRKFRGEDDEDFHITEYQAHKGNAAAMHRMGLLYYYGLRGVRRDYSKAVYWFSKAVEKGNPRVMELLGEIYARGAGVERNYTKAYEWLRLASRQEYYSAYNGLGYLYVKGYGVEKKNFTKTCKMIEPLESSNGAAASCIPVIRDPGLLMGPPVQHRGSERDTRLRVFSGTANPALAQVNHSGLGACILDGR